MRRAFDTSTVTTLIVVLVATARVTPPVRGARILAIETVQGKSHWYFMDAVLRALTDGGHRVTAFTPFPAGHRENYTEVDTSGDFSLLLNMNPTELLATFSGPFATARFLIDMGRHNCEIVYKNDRLNGMLAEGLRSHFDAIVIEPLMSGCVTYAAARSGLPLIFAVPNAVTHSMDRVFLGDFPNPASVSPLTADHAVPRTFARRLSNAAVLLYSTVLVAFRESLYRTTDARPYDFRTFVPPSLVFVNSHYISDAPRPVPSNVVSVGGIHLKTANEIPKDILEFIEDSPHGIILFSFGSTVAISKIPEKVQRVLLDTFAKLPQRVLMKYESEMKNRPKNVMTREWLPQRDILLHPNVILFISHGGISGLYEAVDAGIPVLGYPLFLDQFRNIDHLVEAGMAISQDLLSVSNEEFLKNIKQLINDKKYMENAKISSSIFKDRPMSPQKSVVYWTEYVIRHKGASHLRSHAINLTWYQYFAIDVISVALILVFIIVFIIFKICKCVHKYFLNYLQHVKIKYD